MAQPLTHYGPWYSMNTQHPEMPAAINLKTIDTIHRLWEILPLSAIQPSLQSSSDGMVEIEWYYSQDNLISVDVHDSSLFYAYIIQNNKSCGRLEFSGTFPEIITNQINQLNKLVCSSI